MKRINFAVMAFAVLGLVTTIALAHTGSPAFTTFSSGQVLTAAALNNNFAHLHNSLTGITNDNIAAGAGIVYSKLNLSNSVVAGDIAPGAVGTSEIQDGTVSVADMAAGVPLPKAWAKVEPCSGTLGTACTLAASYGIASVTKGAALGVYTVTMSSALTGDGAAIVTAGTFGTGSVYTCAADTSLDSAGIAVGCRDGTGADADTRFTIIVMD